VPKHVPLSLRLNDDDLAILASLRQRYGLSRSAVVKLALRVLVESEPPRQVTRKETEQP
jgi:hypothetical protein